MTDTQRILEHLADLWEKYRKGGCSVDFDNVLREAARSAGGGIVKVIQNPNCKYPDCQCPPTPFAPGAGYRLCQAPPAPAETTTTKVICPVCHNEGEPSGQGDFHCNSSGCRVSMFFESAYVGVPETPGPSRPVSEPARVAGDDRCELPKTDETAKAVGVLSAACNSSAASPVPTPPDAAQVPHSWRHSQLGGNRCRYCGVRVVTEPPPEFGCDPRLAPAALASADAAQGKAKPSYVKGNCKAWPDGMCRYPDCNCASPKPTSSHPEGRAGERETAIYGADSGDRLPPGGWAPALYLDEVGRQIKGNFYIPDGTYRAGRRVGTEGDDLAPLIEMARRGIKELRGKNGWVDAVLDEDIVPAIDALTRHSTGGDGG